MPGPNIVGTTGPSVYGFLFLLHQIVFGSLPRNAIPKSAIFPQPIDVNIDVIKAFLTSNINTLFML